MLFPDPWWKKKHHKRRLFHAPTVALFHDLLAPGGLFVARTDVPAYADLIDEAVLAHGGFRVAAEDEGDPPVLDHPRTHREKKCAELGIPVYRSAFVRT